MDAARFEGKEEGLLQGKVEGRLEGKEEVIVNGYDKGLSIDLLVNITNLAQETVVWVLKAHGRLV
jgi:predicted transposase YdaD